MMGNEVIRRPGGRSAHVRRQVLDAARELLLERESVAISIPEIATRAGVHYASIYRNWPDKEVLLRDALLDIMDETVPVPDTGSLEQDLISLVSSAIDMYQTPTGRLVLAFTRSEETALTDLLRTYWTARVNALETIFDRAIAGGEISAQTDKFLVFEMILGPILSRQLIHKDSLSTLSIHNLVSIVLRGIRTQ